MANANCDDCLKLTKRPADFLCYDCEKYLCSNCITKHTDHLIFPLKDKNNKNKLDIFCAEMMKQLISEGDQTLEKFTQERTHLCDVVDVEHVGANNEPFNVGDICILRENKTWAMTDWHNKCVIVFKINNNKMIEIIHSAFRPYGITEIPSTDPSQSLIAVSLPFENQIDIMNLHSEQFSSIKVQGACYDLAYCNNKLITLCLIRLDGKKCCSIHVKDLSREIINIIDLKKLTGLKINVFSCISMCVYSESEIIYVCNDNPTCMIGLSLDGQVLYDLDLSFNNTNPRHICVDREQNVYAMGIKLPLYKLSSDLSQRQKVFDEELLNALFLDPFHFRAVACHADTFYVARSDGRVYIVRHE